jgi:hypothetical protein
MACVDTFFSSITSVLGFTCWTQYYFLKSSFDAVYLMRWRSQGPSTLLKIVTNCGAPNHIRSYNVPKFKGQTWMTYLRKHWIQSAFTEACHPNENPCEWWGGALKAVIIHCLTVTNADLEFWCYCLEHICLLQSVIARCWLGWQRSHELHYSMPPTSACFDLNFGVWYGITYLNNHSPSQV